MLKPPLRSCVKAGERGVSSLTRRWKIMPRNQLKEEAYIIFRKALRNGKIHRPNICEMCGADRKQSGVRIVGHHDDYQKPTDVRWVCDQCHAGIHGHNSAGGLVIRLSQDIKEKLLAEKDKHSLINELLEIYYKQKA